MGMGYVLEGIRHVDARLALDGCLKKRWVVLHCIWQGVVAFCYEGRCSEATVQACALI